MTQPDEEIVLDDHLGPASRDLEAPSADAAEQATPANPADRPVRPYVPFEVGEYDAIEQSRVVDLDDDYR